MAARKRFPKPALKSMDDTKYFGVRAGARSDHRFIGIWAVVVEGRLFARSWSIKPTGWFHAFREDPLGALQVKDREFKIRAVPVRSERLRDRVEDAYAEKYNTPGSKMFVRGFRSKRRREATVEFVPR